MHIENVIFLILSKNAYTKFSAVPVIAMSILLLNLRRAVAALLLLLCRFFDLVRQCNDQTEKPYLFSRHY